MKKKWVGWLFSVGLLCALLCGCQTAEESEKPAVEDDFYASVNYETFQQKTIPETEGSWSWSYEITEEVADKLQEAVSLLNTSGENFESGSSEQKINDLYACALDLENRNEQGLLAVEPLLQEINDIETLEDCSNALIDLADNGFQSIIRFSYAQDDMDSSQMAVYFESIDDLIGKEYLDDPEMTQECQDYQEYMTQMFILSGENETDARANTTAIFSMVSQVAAKGLTPAEFYDPDIYYNVYTYNDLTSLYSGIDLSKFLERRGLSESDQYVVMEKDAISTLNSYFTEENIPILKEYIKFVLLKDLAPYGSVEYRDLALEMERKLNGASQQKTNERLAYDEVDSLLEWDLAKTYIENSFDEARKNDVKSMIEQIISEYKEIINSQNWMSEETKAKTILKLDKMTVKVGYPDEWPSICEALSVTPFSEGGSNLSNVVAIQAATQANKDAEYQKGVDRDFWYITPQTVNAYYNPANNEIVFPAAILQAPLYDINQSDATNLGGIGAVIGHEISHAFDETGSLYNENGNYEIWWTDQEYQKYDEMSQSIVAYYDQYTIASGEHVDGELTLGENIADLGGVAVVTQLAKDQGYDLDEVYTSYATIWAYLTTDELAQQNLLTDVHSPRKVRVNAVLSSMDDFYEVYDIMEGDNMYVAPDQRVGIWMIEE
ncbi:M13 family metallopeptidase [Eubacteriaceae bacterium ES2]|nr:M13 family metallopeptidase [Eubacteriaceae bacterium ES2]